MWIILAVMLSLLGGILVYLSNKHQRFISKKLSKYWRMAGYLILIFAFIAWRQMHVVSASIFLWFFTISVVLVCIPLLSLMINFSKNKGSSQWED